MKATAATATRPAKRDPENALRGFLSQELWAGRSALCVRDVASALNVTEQHVVNLIVEGRLKAVNIGNGEQRATRGYWRIPVCAWDAYIRDNVP